MLEIEQLRWELKRLDNLVDRIKKHDREYVKNQFTDFEVIEGFVDNALQAVELSLSENELRRISFWYGVCEVESQDVKADYPLLRKLQKHANESGLDVDFEFEEK